MQGDKKREKDHRTSLSLHQKIEIVKHKRYPPPACSSCFELFAYIFVVRNITPGRQHAPGRSLLCGDASRLAEPDGASLLCDSPRSACARCA